MSLRVIAAVVVIAVVAGVVHGILLGVLLTIERRLVEHRVARPAVGAADIVDAGVARERAVGLIAPRAVAASARPASVGEGLLMVAAAHHAADAVEQERAAH